MSFLILGIGSGAGSTGELDWALIGGWAEADELAPTSAWGISQGVDAAGTVG